MVGVVYVVLYRILSFYDSKMSAMRKCGDPPPRLLRSYKLLSKVYTFYTILTISGVPCKRTDQKP